MPSCRCSIQLSLIVAAIIAAVQLSLVSNDTRSSDNLIKVIQLVHKVEVVCDDQGDSEHGAGYTNVRSSFAAGGSIWLLVKHLVVLLLRLFHIALWLRLLLLTDLLADLLTDLLADFPSRLLPFLQHFLHPADLFLLHPADLLRHLHL